MRIALAGETYPPDLNGAAIFAERLATGLVKRGHDVHVISPSPTGNSYLEVRNGVLLHRVPSYRYPWHPSFHIADVRRVSAAVAEAIDQIDPAVLHLQAHFIVGRAAATEARRRSIPVVATNHFMPDNLRSQAPVRLPEPVYRLAAALAWRDLARVLSRCDAITAPTSYAVDMLKARTGDDRAVAISCGVDTTVFTPHDRPIGPHLSTVLYVGRLDAEKHVGEIIKALGHLPPAVRLRVVGEGSQRSKLVDLARALGVGDRVDFLGPVDDGTLRAEYAEADLFCMPGRAELQSIATLEAMASGLPVIAANSHALPLLVRSGVNGELFEPGDIVGLARAVGSVLADEDRWRQMGLQSRALADQHNLDRTLDAFESLYAQVSSG